MPRNGHDWNGWVWRRRLQTLGCACVALLRRTARHDNLADEWQPRVGSLIRRDSAARTRARRACAPQAAPACVQNTDDCLSASCDTSRAAVRYPRADARATRVMPRCKRTETPVQRSSSPVPFRSRRKRACSASKSAPFLAQRVQLDFDMLPPPREGACNTPETCSARR